MAAREQTAKPKPKPVLVTRQCAHCKIEVEAAPDGVAVCGRRVCKAYQTWSDEEWQLRARTARIREAMSDRALATERPGSQRLNELDREALRRWPDTPSIIP